MLNELLQIIPIHLALTTGRGDSNQLWRWVLCWACLVVTLMLMDFLQRGILVKTILVIVLAGNNASGSELVLGRAEPLIVGWDRKIRDTIAKLAGYVQATMLYLASRVVEAVNSNRTCSHQNLRED